MLNGIKSMIQEKTAFLETASVIFEDGSGMNLDDQIILGESEDDLDNDIDNDDDDIVNGSDSNNIPNSDESDSSNNDISTNIEDEPVLDTKVDNGNSDSNNITDDLLDSPANNNDDEDSSGGLSNLPGEDIPQPVGAQIGEPVNPLDNILNIEVDLGSNTVKDVLPVPPASASDVVPTDNNENITQHVDSGFGNMNKSSYIESFFGSIGLGRPYEEAITLADPVDNSNDSNDSKPSETVDSDISSEDNEESGTEESPVTSAVKDKVAESDDDMSVDGVGGSEEKVDILKKLSSITKNIEDVKKAVMNSIQ